jgi:phenylalanyl-tRNA synthetase beta chain
VDLNPEFLLITDADRPVALGGVMGGLDTSVTDDTTDVFLGSAYFKPSTIIGRARKLGMSTDAAHRFERGVDPQLQRTALERATDLLLEIVGGEAGPIVEAVAKEHLPEVRPVELRRQRLAMLIGMTIPDADVERILTRLGMQVEPTPDGWRVTPGSARFDIELEVDLIEEVARIYGYNEVPEAVPAGELPGCTLPEERVDLMRARYALIERGYHEAVTYAFVSKEQLAPLGHAESALPLANPLSSDMSVMRSALAPGLLAALVYNQHRQHDRVRLFEVGVAFEPDPDNPQSGITEDNRIAALIWGRSNPQQWSSGDRGCDYYDLKGDVEALMALTGAGDEFRFVPEKFAFLHPGQSARIMRGNRSVGWIGALHPNWLKSADAKGPVYGFELSIEPLLGARVPKYLDISRFPSIRRDLAIIVDESVCWSQIEQIVEETSGNLLTGLVVFDEYRGDGIEQGRKSIAMGLTLQDRQRTLTDQDVDKLQEAVITRLSDDLNADLRG